MDRVINFMKRWTSSNHWLLLLMPGLIVFFIFFILPFIWLIRVSFYENIVGAYMKEAWILDNYKRFLGDSWYIKKVFFSSFTMALGSVFSAIILSYPMAIAITKSTGQKKRFLLTVVLSPLLVSMVCLLLGMILLLRNQGVVNLLLQQIGIISKPIKMIYNNVGVFIGLTYIAIPYVVLSLLDNLSRMDPSLEEAAFSVGATGLQTFLNVTLPLSIPGLFAGSIIILSMNFCAFAIPLMMGFDAMPAVGLVVYRQALTLNNVPFAAALTIFALLFIGTILFIYRKFINKFFFSKLGV